MIFDLRITILDYRFKFTNNMFLVVIVLSTRNHQLNKNYECLFFNVSLGEHKIS